jgi:alpha-beta hydrolase superfamily lysophospholipase
VLVRTGGIDGYKEDHARLRRAFLAAGLATLIFDMPGVGESPVTWSEDAERLWDDVFDWIAARPAGHMGPGPETGRVIVEWLRERLAQSPT